METNITLNDKKPLLKGWVSALLIILPFFIVAGAFQLAGYLLLGYDLESPPETLTGETVIQLIALTGTLLLVFIFTRYIDRATFKNLGFQLKGHGKDIFLGIALGAIIMSLGFYILWASGEINITNIDFDSYKLLLSIVLFACISFNEEILLRGYILNNFSRSMNKYWALLCSSLVFSVLHVFNPDFDWMGFSSILLSGLLLGTSYIYTKNLWFPVALHFSWNFFQGTVFGFHVSGNSTYAIIHQQHKENNLLNGGEFGFEGSILSLLFIVAAILLVGWRFSKKQIKN
ncbi:MAG: CPBP family intramembrane metalloprotease [Prevotellaceae bacterium]|jgi:membrane protease YdiL (CAAX protease family)|nr:CPBP family intramembrane metalloprotease [Prevotellaceae bacterium]